MDFNVLDGLNFFSVSLIIVALITLSSMIDYMLAGRKERMLKRYGFERRPGGWRNPVTEQYIFTETINNMSVERLEHYLRWCKSMADDFDDAGVKR